MEDGPVRSPTRILRFSAALFLISLPIPGRILAVEPGVDIAAPRVAISQVGDFIGFQPPSPTVEQGDYVRWSHTGTIVSHTTTSGSACTASGLWNQSLAPGAQFTRQFIESPQAIPYFCVPHCLSGMTGTVTVTTHIALQAAVSAGSINLSWTGGGALYRVNRSDSPGFTSAGTAVLTPIGGDGGTTFSDPLQPPVGGVLFYLVSDKF
jgi:plastocyanin